MDITESQYKAAVCSYGAVGDWLAKPDSSLAPYKPFIRPQGSFLLGTMIKPICEEDDMDIDLVCELTGKQPQWTQWHLKQAIGNRLKENETYKKMLDKEGRRCWTLIYSDDSKFHMDILPSLVCAGYGIVLEKAFSSSAIDKNYESLAIRITDNKQSNYYTDTITDKLTLPLVSLLSNDVRSFLRLNFGEKLDKLSHNAILTLATCCTEKEVSNNRLQFILEIHRLILQSFLRSCAMTVILYQKE